MIEQDPNETVMIHTTTGAITNLDRGMVWRLIEMVDDAIMFNEQALKNDPDPDDEKPVYELPYWGNLKELFHYYEKD